MDCPAIDGAAGQPAFRTISPEASGPLHVLERNDSLPSEVGSGAVFDGSDASGSSSTASPSCRPDDELDTSHEGAVSAAVGEEATTRWPTSSAPIAITTKLTCEGTQLSLVREISCGDETVVEVVCWSRSHVDIASAQDVFEVMAPLQTRFPFWSVGAIAIGAGWLAPQLEAVIAERLNELAEERERTSRELEKERLRQKEEQEAETGISAYFREKKGSYLLTLERGSDHDTPIWSISLEEAWERDRFWDWLCWQTERFEEFAEFMRDGCRLELERKLLREMLVTEQAVKKQGLGSGGRRPLRFWRGEL